MTAPLIARLPAARPAALRLGRIAAAGAGSLAISAVVGVPAAGAAAPVVEVSVATSQGKLLGPLPVRASEVRLKVGARRCTVAAGTPLAALAALRAKAPAGFGAIQVKDYSGCGRRPSSSARLYLLGIGADRAAGPDGWIYRVDERSGTAGAADPAGPFSKGRLTRGQRIAWRWCAASTDLTGGCGDELVIQTLRAAVDGSVSPSATTVRVGVQVRTGSAGAEQPGTLSAAPAGLTVRVTTLSGAPIVGGVTAADGTAELALPPATTGRLRVVVAPASAPVTGAPSAAPAGRLLTIAG